MGCILLSLLRGACCGCCPDSLWGACCTKWWWQGHGRGPVQHTCQVSHSPALLSGASGPGRQLHAARERSSHGPNRVPRHADEAMRIPIAARVRLTGAALHLIGAPAHQGPGACSAGPTWPSAAWAACQCWPPAANAEASPAGVGTAPGAESSGPWPGRQTGLPCQTRTPALAQLQGSAMPACAPVGCLRPSRS